MGFVISANSSRPAGGSAGGWQINAGERCSDPRSAENPGLARTFFHAFADNPAFHANFTKSHAGRACPETIPAPTSLK
jgi:hypothetical protein